MKVPAEIAKRIRQPAPAESETSLITGSLPVISFGDAFTARVASIALNPSWAEFHYETDTQPKERRWIEPGKERLSSLHTLGLTSSDQLTDDHVEKVYSDCVSYFSRNPYKKWFGSLNTFLKEGLNADYYDGSACHLDLVQWATAKKQSDLVKDLPGAWEKLVEADASFLRWQMETTSADTFVINGMHVLEVLTAAGFIPQLTMEARTFINEEGGKKTVSFYSGRANGKLFVGWNNPAATAWSIPARQWVRDLCIDAIRPVRPSTPATEVNERIGQLSLAPELTRLVKEIADKHPVQIGGTSTYVSVSPTSVRTVAIYVHPKRISIALEPQQAKDSKGRWSECSIEDDNPTTHFLHIPLSRVQQSLPEVLELCLSAIKRREVGPEAGKPGEKIKIPEAKICPTCFVTMPLTGLCEC